MGATGGRRIVNALINVLAHRVGESKSLLDAVKAPRIHTEGGLGLTVEGDGTAADLNALGYTAKKGLVASLSAIELERTASKLRLTSAAR
jgi:gamma-glutamyltranspeptidase / glutathione hydrolase